MSKHKAHHKKAAHPPKPTEPAEPSAPADPAGASAVPVDGLMPPDTLALAGGALLEPPEQAIQRLTQEVEELKDQRLRLAAEFDNFKKRSQRERAESWSRAQAELVAGILDGLDDLGRVAHLDPATAKAGDVLAGIELVERKLLRTLGVGGLERLGADGEPFDPHAHEAVSTTPAPSADQDHVIASVLQPGYRFGGALLRPARVVVYVWQEPAPTDAPSPGP